MRLDKRVQCADQLANSLAEMLEAAGDRDAESSEGSDERLVVGKVSTAIYASRLASAIHHFEGPEKIPQTREPEPLGDGGDLHEADIGDAIVLDPGEVIREVAELLFVAVPPDRRARDVSA